MCLQNILPASERLFHWLWQMFRQFRVNFAPNYSTKYCGSRIFRQIISEILKFTYPSAKYSVKYLGSYFSSPQSHEYFSELFDEYFNSKIFAKFMAVVYSAKTYLKPGIANQRRLDKETVQLCIPTSTCWLPPTVKISAGTPIGHMT